MVSLQGMNSDAFEQSWSVIVRMVSYPSDTGSFVIKSSAIVWNGSDWVEWGFHWVRVYFVHLARCTSFDILRDVVAHAWPPVILCNILCCFGDSGMSCSDVVVKKGNHPPLKIVVSHND
jgi:hypothetical protein